MQPRNPLQITYKSGAAKLFFECDLITSPSHTSSILFHPTRKNIFLKSSFLVGLRLPEQRTTPPVVSSAGHPSHSEYPVLTTDSKDKLIEVENRI